mgnify:CR=1 FL=1
MVLDTGTLIAITIALAGSVTVMCLFWKQNIQMQREIRRLQAVGAPWCASLCFQRSGVGYFHRLLPGGGCQAWTGG